MDEVIADWFRLDAELVAAAGIMGLPVWVSRELSDILEVAPEWQELESFNARVLGLLKAMKARWTTDALPFQIPLTVPDPMTHGEVTHQLLCRFDGGDLHLELANEAT